MHRSAKDEMMGVAFFVNLLKMFNVTIEVRETAAVELCDV
jgi:hypothetical protein